MDPTPNRRRLASGLIGLLVGVVIAGIIAGVVIAATTITQVADKQDSNTVKSEKRDLTLARIRNCTTPGRPCYERGQRQLARAVADVNRVVVYAAACASGPQQQDVDEISACVLARLAEARKSH